MFSMVGLVILRFKRDLVGVNFFGQFPLSLWREFTLRCCRAFACCATCG